MRQLMQVIEAALSEATADLDGIYVERHKQWGGECYTITCPLEGEAFLELSLRVDGDVLDVVDLLVEGPDDHPDRFQTTNSDWRLYKSGIRLGTAEMRRVLKAMIGIVRKEHPEIRSVKAERITGARYKNGKTDLDLPLPANL